MVPAPSPPVLQDETEGPAHEESETPESAAGERATRGAEAPQASDASGAAADTETAPAERDSTSQSVGDAALTARRTRVAARQSTALVVLACIAVALALYIGRAVFLPVTFALMIAVTLRPIVRRARRKRVPESLTAALLIIGLALLAAVGLYFLAAPAREWSSDLSGKMEQLGAKLSVVRERVEQFEEASERLEDIAEGKATGEALATQSSPSLDPISETPAPAEDAAEEPVEVEVRQPRLTSSLNVLSSAGSLAGSMVLACVMAFFLLSQGDVLINNFLRTLPTMREKRSTVQLIYDVERGISRYLLTVTTINVLLGLAVATAMWLLGMPNPVLWGVMATALNFIPFLGAMVGTVIVLFVAIISFDSLAYASLAPLTYMALTSLEGNLITPSLLGRTMSLNPIMVLLSLIVWGWMWGVGGALLAVPILAMLKIGFDHFERTRAIGTLLGGGSR